MTETLNAVDLSSVVTVAEDVDLTEDEMGEVLSTVATLAARDPEAEVELRAYDPETHLSPVVLRRPLVVVKSVHVSGSEKLWDAHMAMRLGEYLVTAETVEYFDPDYWDRWSFGLPSIDQHPIVAAWYEDGVTVSGDNYCRSRKVTYPVGAMGVTGVGHYAQPGITLLSGIFAREATLEMRMTRLDSTES